MDVVPGPLPALHLVLGAELSGQRDGAVQRHPAHDLRVHEILLGAADFPDALVLAGPAVRGGIGDGDQEGPGGRIELADLVAQPADRREQLAVDIDLALVPGPVADPDRGAAPPAGQVGKHPLGQVPFTAHAEHDLQVGAAVQGGGRGRAQEGEELRCLIRAGRHPQRVHRQTGVAHPGEAIVPVAGTARSFRQRGRRCRHNRARRVERQGLQDPAAGVDQLAPRARIPLVDLRPGPPPSQSVLQPLGQFTLRPHLRYPPAKLAIMQPERDTLANCDAEAPHDGTVADL